MQKSFLSSYTACAALLLLGSVTAGCGSGSAGRMSSSPGGGGTDAGGPTGQEFQFGALSGRAALSNPPVTTNGYGATITGLKGDISSLTMNDTAPTLAETRIAYESSRDGDWNIYVMNADGSNPVRLTTNSAADNRPAWRPDGMKLAFDSLRDGNFEIYTVNPDGSNQTRLTNNTDDDLRPAWSPDGTRIAFDSTRDGSYQVYIMNANGTGQTQLTRTAGNNSNASWSPDGTKIAFNSFRDGNSEIYVINTDGTGERRLTNNAATDDSPAWSPDGTKIAFESTRDGIYQVYMMNADGSSQTRVTSDSEYDYMPTWSPDGTKLVFWSIRNGNGDIYTINTNGAGLTRLTTDLGEESRPAWSPFIKQRKLIGPSGTLSAANVGGFLFARGRGSNNSPGEVINSILAFDGNPRSGVLLSTQSGLNNNGPTLTYVIEADSPNTLTLLSYLNSPDFFAPIKVIGTGTNMPTANGALVDYSADTGKVTAVLPFIGTRAAGAGKPVVKEEGGRQTVQGTFLGVFDGKGKNLAPHGAREVQIDTKTGAVLSAR